jgi:hypothetical protein
MIEANGNYPAAIPDLLAGVYYHGRPSWMTDDLLAALRSEAAVQRPDAVLTKRQFHVAAGPCGSGLARLPEMLSLIAGHAVPVTASGAAASYLYYERPGDGIDPHLDLDEFDLNTLVLIAHSWQAEAASRLVIFPHGPERRQEFLLAPGELVLFRATGVIHGRSAVAENEMVCTLGIGYKPRVKLPQSDFWLPKSSAAT